MGLNLTSQKINQLLRGMPDEGLSEIYNFIQQVRSKYPLENSEPLIKLGGVLSDYDIDITEGDIARARSEMWGNFGELKK